MLSEWKISVIKLKTWEGYLLHPKLCTDRSFMLATAIHPQPRFSIWRSSGISVRTGLICLLHLGYSQTWRGTWPWCSPSCRWHPTAWPLFTFQFFWVGVSSSSSYWLNSRVDVLEPALSQHRQVYNDIVTALDARLITALLLLDFSAAFDCVDPSILLQVLELKFGITASALKWIASFLTDRTHSVRVGTRTSKVCNILFGVPQGSILGPLLFILYTPQISRTSPGGMVFSSTSMPMILSST